MISDRLPINLPKIVAGLHTHKNFTPESRNQTSWLMLVYAQYICHRYCFSKSHDKHLIVPYSVRSDLDKNPFICKRRHLLHICNTCIWSVSLHVWLGPFWNINISVSTAQIHLRITHDTSSLYTIFVYTSTITCFIKL